MASVYETGIDKSMGKRESNPLAAGGIHYQQREANSTNSRAEDDDKLRGLLRSNSEPPSPIPTRPS